MIVFTVLTLSIYSSLILLVGFIVGYILKDPDKYDQEEMAEEDEKRIEELEKEIENI